MTDNPNNPPKVMTLEEMEALLADVQKNTKPSKTAKRRNKKVPPPETPSVAKNAKPTDVPEAACFMDIHFWLREGDLFGTVCNDARDEKQFRGPGVMIFAHNHQRSQPCNNDCKEIK